MRIGLSSFARVSTAFFARAIFGSFPMITLAAAAGAVAGTPGRTGAASAFGRTVGSIIPSTVSTTRRPSAGFLASRPVSSVFGSSKTHECSSATSVWSALRPPMSADSPNEVPEPTCATTRSAPASLTETRRKRPRYTRSIPESGCPARTTTVPAGTTRAGSRSAISLRVSAASDCRSSFDAKSDRLASFGISGTGWRKTIDVWPISIRQPGTSTARSTLVPFTLTPLVEWRSSST